MTDQSILSLPFVRPGVLVQCSNCGEKAADVYAADEEAALAGRGVCNNCAPKVVAPLPVALVDETEEVPEAEAADEVPQAASRRATPARHRPPAKRS